MQIFSNFDTEMLTHCNLSTNSTQVSEVVKVFKS